MEAEVTIATDSARSIEDIVPAQHRWLFTRRGEEGQPLLALHPGWGLSPPSPRSITTVPQGRVSRLRWRAVERGFGRSEVTTKPDLRAKYLLPQPASLHRNAITSDAVTRFWRGSG